MQGWACPHRRRGRCRVAHALDDLGIDLEAGFLLQPKEEEVFRAARGRAGFTRADRRLRDDAPPRRGRRRGSRPTRAGPTASRRSAARWSARRDALHLEKVLRVSRDELAIITESIAFLVGAGKRVIYDAEHFFDGYRDGPPTRWPSACARPSPAGPRRSSCTTQRLRRCPGRSRRPSRDVVAQLGDRSASASTAMTTRAAAAQPTPWPACGRGHPVHATVNGTGERTGNANMMSVIPNLQLKMGRPVVTDQQLALWPRHAHFVGRASSATARPNAQQPLRRQARLHPQGGLHAPPACARTPRPSSTSCPRWSATSATSSSPSSPGTTWSRQGGRVRHRHRRRHRQARDRARSQLEHLGYHFEAADGSLGAHAARGPALQATLHAGVVDDLVEQRADGVVATEATIKIWIDGERFVRTAEATARSALDNALRSTRPSGDPPAPGRDRAGQLQGPHPGLLQRHRERRPPAC